MAELKKRRPFGRLFRLGKCDLMFTPLEIMPRCSAAGLGFIIIPAGFNAPLEFLTGFTLQCLGEIFSRCCSDTDDHRIRIKQKGDSSFFKNRGIDGKGPEHSCIQGTYPVQTACRPDRPFGVLRAQKPKFSPLIFNGRWRKRYILFRP